MLKNLLANKSFARETITQDTIDILRLYRSENIGPRTFLHLIEIFGDASVALENVDELSKRGGINKPIKLYSRQAAEKELSLLEKYNANFITYKNDHYSRLLKEIFDFPPILTYKGNINLLNHNPTIAIVGSRNASLHGKQLTTKLAIDLTNAGYVVASGLARGIDTAAHSANIQKTIAVVAGGVDQIYPEENTKLYEEIANNGLVISEYPVNSKPIAQHFPQRNRIISGLSIGTVVVEAKLNSGSLITARIALEQNREVFAVPGFPMDPRYNGTNKLIKEGAHCVETAQDIIDNISIHMPKNIFSLHEETNNTQFDIGKNLFDIKITNTMRKSILNLLSTIPIDIDFIIKETDLPIQVVHLIILELELAGKVIRLPRNKIILAY